METNEQNELVDLYVDDECSTVERAAIEARAQTDERLRSEIAWAMTLRRRLKAMSGAQVPADFSERLQSALRESPAWDALSAASRTESPRVNANSNRAERRAALVPAIVGTAVVVAIVALCALAFLRLRQAPTDKPMAEENALEKVATPETDLIPEQNVVIRTPAAEGNPAPNEAKTLSEDQFWSTAIVPVDDLKKATFRFQTQCGKLELEFTKFDNDVEFLVRNAGSDDWAELSSALDEFGALRESQALREWRDSSAESTQDVRVSFKTSEE